MVKEENRRDSVLLTVNVITHLSKFFTQVFENVISEDRDV